MKIAIIGSGVSGLAAARTLDAKHTVTIFEKAPRLGGHAHTVHAKFGDKTVPVDVGFIVFNRLTYPLFSRALRDLKVKVRATRMAFSVQIESEDFEWGTTGINAALAQIRNLVSYKFYRMIFDIMRFFRISNASLESSALDGLTAGQFLRKHSFSSAFEERFFVPMCRSIWSSSKQEVLEYPAYTLLNFLQEHGLLSFKQPIWLTVQGGSEHYVNAIQKELSAEILTNCEVTSVARGEGKVVVRDSTGAKHSFDHVIFACHAPDVLRLLENPSEEEQSVLGAFRYTRNSVILHSDPSFMPKNKSAWSSWNYFEPENAEDEHSSAVTLTYWMNFIQHISNDTPLFVTLNPPADKAIKKIHDEFQFDHPQFNQDAISSQSKLDLIQGNNGVWFCGAYTRYGFHEDGWSSGTSIASRVMQQAFQDKY